MKHKVKHDSDAQFHREVGTTGQSVYMMDYESATDEYDLPTAKRCPVCSYDRCRVTIQHNPELGDEVEARCGACGCELQSAVNVARQREEYSYR